MATAPAPDVLQPWAPYCGPAPAPAELAARWNLDPWLLAALIGGALAYALHRRRGGEGRDGLFAAAMVLLLIAFVSPLCALSSALFSARVAHHALLIAGAAPLAAFALPVGRPPSLTAATILHAVVVWTWHAPAPYAWALGGDTAYAMMEATLALSAFGLWSAIRRADGLSAAGALLLTMMQTGLLGALITFAPSPVYAPHLGTAGLWGLSPLEDQQLAGVLMWTLMAAPYLLAALALAGRSLAPARAAAP